MKKVYRNLGTSSRELAFANQEWWKEKEENYVMVWK
jgi:hypothetical protein